MSKQNPDDSDSNPLANIDPDIQLAMRLIDSSKGLTHDAGVVLLLDTARWSLPITVGLFSHIGRMVKLAATSDDFTGIEAMRQAVQDTVEDITDDVRRGRRRGNDGLGLSDFAGYGARLLKNVDDAVRRAADPPPRIGRKGRKVGGGCGRADCGFCNPRAEQVTPAPAQGLPRLGRFLVVPFTGTATGAEPDGFLTVIFDAMQEVDAVRDQFGVPTGFAFSAENLDLATARVEFEQLGGFVHEAALVVEGSVGTQPIRLRLGLSPLVRHFLANAPRDPAAPPRGPLEVILSDGPRIDPQTPARYLSGVSLARSVPTPGAPQAEQLLVQLTWTDVTRGTVRMEPAAPVAPAEPVAAAPPVAPADPPVAGGAVTVVTPTVVIPTLPTPTPTPGATEEPPRGGPQGPGQGAGG